MRVVAIFSGALLALAIGTTVLELSLPSFDDLDNVLRQRALDNAALAYVTILPGLPLILANAASKPPAPGVREIAESDATITQAIKVKLAQSKELHQIVIVDTVVGRVTLYGVVPNFLARRHATDMAWSVKGVIGVDNQLSVAGV